METSPPGTILSFNSEVEPDGWIICDGVKRMNTCNIYKNLIEMEIGTLTEDNYYTPPDYSGSIISKVDESCSNKINLLKLMNITDKISNVNCHNYIVNKKFVNSYNKYVNKLKFNVNFIDNNIYWIIKY